MKLATYTDSFNVVTAYRPSGEICDRKPIVRWFSGFSLKSFHVMIWSRVICMWGRIGASA